MDRAADSTTGTKYQILQLCTAPGVKTHFPDITRPTHPASQPPTQNHTTNKAPVWMRTVVVSTHPEAPNSGHTQRQTIGSGIAGMLSAWLNPSRGSAYQPNET
jgi:hypothetical protein